MSKLLLVQLCLATLAYSGESNTLTIALSSPPSSEAVLPEMQSEVSRILQRAELEPAWMGIRDASGSDHARLVVVELTGNCSSTPLRSSSLVQARGGALASTQVSDGRVLSFASVDCNALRRFMAPAISAATSKDRVRLVGKALGRLVAHEIYHMLAQTKHHQSSGVARSCFSLNDLTSDEFHFEDAAIAALRPLPVPIDAAAADEALTARILPPESVAAGSR